MCGECKIFRVQLHVNGNLLTVTAFCLSNIFMAHSGAVAVLHKNKKKHNNNTELIFREYHLTCIRAYKYNIYIYEYIQYMYFFFRAQFNIFVENN